MGNVFRGDTEETVDENGISTPSALTQTQSEAHQSLAAFWPKVNEEIKKMKIVCIQIRKLTKHTVLLKTYIKIIFRWI